MNKVIIKRVVAAIFILAAFLTVRYSSDLLVNHHLHLDSDDIDRISIASSHFGSLDIEDKQQIVNVVDCLVSFKPTESKLNPYYYVGGAHTLILRFKNKFPIRRK
jgi:dihydroxyacid dehydratase/phosphogluconate dehydratase